MSRPIMAANWKMHNGIEESIRLVEALRPLMEGIEGADVVICPPFTALQAVGRALSGTRLALGAQNVHWEERGAFTGEISPAMLRDVGCAYAIVGHSERRTLFGESDRFVGLRLKGAIEHGLNPILCVGETLQQRQLGQTEGVVGGQLAAALEALDPGQVSGLVVAYEPVWAIGTGRTADPSDAAAVAAHVRRVVAGLKGDAVARTLRVQYGGSVKPDNIAAFTAAPGIDGALVGGASLDADSFAEIVRRGMEGAGG